jgi:2-keto-4-pentenoate hydratase
MLLPALAARGKSLAAGQIIITGSLIGMNWLTGRHDLKGVIDDLGEVGLELAAT